MDHDAEIIKLWDQGLTATQIGKHLGRTRSSILGRISRMREKGVDLEKRAHSSRKIKRGRGSGKPRKYILEQRTQYVLPLEALAISPKNPIKPIEQTRKLLSLFDLPHDACRYIVDRSSEGALYCAQITHRRQMCKAHYNLCYIRIKT